MGYWVRRFCIGSFSFVFSKELCVICACWSWWFFFGVLLFMGYGLRSFGVFILFSSFFFVEIVW